MKILKEMGGTHVLNSSSETFKEEMKAIFEETKSNVFLDCVSGGFGSDVLRAMPNGSHLVGYGSLVDEPYNLTSKEIRFSDKSISGFALKSWMGKNPGILGKYGN